MKEKELFQLIEKVDRWGFETNPEYLNLKRFYGDIVHSGGMLAIYIDSLNKGVFKKKLEYNLWIVYYKSPNQKENIFQDSSPSIKKLYENASQKYFLQREKPLIDGKEILFNEGTTLLNKILS